MTFEHFIMKISNKNKKKVLTKTRHNFITNCLEDVLQYLKDDPRTLYSCILVNRNWCRIAIPILWRDPFNNNNLRRNNNNNNHNHNNHNNHNSNPIRTLISCLEDTEKSLLINEFINIPKDYFNEALFDYPKYLQIFKYEHFGKILENFVKMNDKILIEGKPDFNRIYMIITSVIMNMIFKKSKRLRTLHYVHDHISSQRTIYTLDLLLYSYNNSRLTRIIGSEKSGEGGGKNRYATLSKLTNLTFFAYCIHEESYNFIWPNFFNTLAKLAKNIQEIFIHFPSDGEIDSDLGKVYPAIANLIKSQRNLKSLEINESHRSKMDQEIINSLILTQSNNLTNFKINGEIKFSHLIQLLEFCKNLKSIYMYKLNNYGSTTSKDIKTLTKSFTTTSLEKFCHWNPHLQFQYQKNNADYEITLILKMITKNLKKFACNYFCDDIFNTIIKYCINLSHLCLFITFDNFEKLSNLLPFMNNLSYLYLESSKIDTVLIKTNMLKLLSSSLPNSLNHLSLNLFIPLEFLKTFLVHCNVNLNILELYNIQDVNYKLFIHVNDYYDRKKQLKLLKLDNNLYSKFNGFLYHIHKKKISYNVVESLKPIWFDEE